VIELSENKEEVIQCRKLLLDFYSSELATHSRLIIGFTVILFTLASLLLEVTQSSQQTISVAQFRIIYLSISLVAFGLWFLLMRHFVYGILATQALYATPSEDHSKKNRLKRMLCGVAQKALEKRILGIIPVCLFFSTGTRISRLQRAIGVAGARLLGLLLCAILAILTAEFIMSMVGIDGIIFPTLKELLRAIFLL